MKRAAAYVCGVIATTASFAQAMTGCNTIGDITPTDASVNDVVHVDAALAACAVNPPPVMKYLDQQANEQPGDWSCYAPDAGFFFPLGLDAGDDAGDDASDAAGDDAATTPDAALDGGVGDAGADGGTVNNARFRLTDFVNLTPVGGAQVDLFFNNALGTPDFQGVTADSTAGDGGPNTPAAGEFLFPAPGTPLMGYRVASSTGVKPLIWLDIQSAKVGGTLLASSISPMSYDLLGGGILGGVAVDPMKMTAVIGVRDCQYRDVLGGQLEFFEDATGTVLVPGQGDFRADYFGPNGFPDSTCTHTVAQQSLYAAVNIPTDRDISVRAMGRMSESDTTPVVLGTRKIPRAPGFIIIVRPYRLTP